MCPILLTYITNMVKKLKKSANKVGHCDLDIGHSELDCCMPVDIPLRDNNYHIRKECAKYCRNMPPK